MAVTEGIRRPVPEGPWWSPLVLVGFVLAMLVGVTWMSSVWPLPDAGLAIVRGWLQRAVGVGFGLWVALAVWLRMRRQALDSESVPVVVDDRGLSVDGVARVWAEIAAVEWSPFGVVIVDEQGRRDHIPARVTDEQADTLQKACDAKLSR